MTTDSRPAPLVPADCCLRSLEWFPLYYKRLERSGWWVSASDVARSRSVDLWVAAYQEQPAASLPDRDVDLAKLAGFGRDLDAWKVVKAEIMAPWLLCSDGRWYHPTLAEVAVEVWERTEEKRRKEREKKARQRAAKAEASPEKPASSPGDNPDLKGGKRDTIHNKTEQKKVRGGESGDGGAGEGAPPKAPPKARAERGTRLPFGFHPGEKGLAFAEGLGLSRDEIWAITDSFVDYWRAQPGQKGIKLDWPATWRNWIRKEVERRIERGGRNGGAGVGRARSAAGSPAGAARAGRMFEGAVAALERRGRG